MADRIRRHLTGAALVLAGCLSLATPALAQSTVPGADDAQRLAIEGMDKILKALGLLIQTIPQYTAPEVLENGDIIIRRLHPDDKPKVPEDGHSNDGADT